MKKGVAGFGIANIDFIFGNSPRMPGLGEEIYSESCSRQLGGGPVATLIQLARLGVPVELATYVGTGPLSRFLAQELKKNRVEYKNMLASREPDPVTLSCIVSCREDRGIISYKPREECFAVDEQQLYQFYSERKIAYVTIEQRHLCQRLKDAGCIVVMDSAWSDALSLEWYHEIFPYVDYFIPNECEAMKITGTENPGDALRELSKYLNTAIIKTGHQGCLLLDHGNEIRIPASPAEHVDSTGAGDAFAAGFMYGLYHNCNVIECICYGNITGGNAVTKIGCLAAEMNEDNLKAEFKKIYGKLQTKESEKKQFSNRL